MGSRSDLADFNSYIISVGGPVFLRTQPGMVNSSMQSTHSNILIRYARPIGWGLTALAFLPAAAWRFELLGPARSVYTLMWLLILCVIIITTCVIVLANKSKCHDLIIAGLIAFNSPLILLYIPIFFVGT
ncbi:MAG: hypothetical protein Q4A92_07830 [Corynebacterium sp.]|nr:hypothetical protein [Corynebacterium sp.]